MTHAVTKPHRKCQPAPLCPTQIFCLFLKKLITSWYYRSLPLSLNTYEALEQQALSLSFYLCISRIYSIHDLRGAHKHLMDGYGPEGRLKLCNRLATQILLINNLQPELQNSASPSTRLHGTISCIHLVCPAPSNTPWDQDQFISFLTNGTYVQAQSCCFNISAPALY